MSVSSLAKEEHVALEAIQNDLSAIFASVSKKYMKQWDIDCAKQDFTLPCPPIVQHIKEVFEKLNILYKCQIIPVEPDYYDWELQQRAFRVGAPSRAHMCKSVILENTRCTHGDISDPLYSRYYCVITQYITPVNTQKLLNYARGLKNKEISKKNYNFRLADPEVSLKMTGFEKGGVSPIGMKDPIPVILAESVTKLEPPIAYLGAGHIDWKLGIPISVLVETTKCFIADLD